MWQEGCSYLCESRVLLSEGWSLGHRNGGVCAARLVFLFEHVECFLQGWVQVVRSEWSVDGSSGSPPRDEGGKERRQRWKWLKALF